MGKKIVLLSIALCCLPIQANSEALLGWDKHIIGQQDKSIYLYVKDIDGDGDLDVASTTNNHPYFYESEVAWFRNNMQQELPWEKFIISSRTPLENAISNSNGIVVADIDGDGHEDVAVGTGRVMVDIGSVYWFKAPANPTGTWEKYAIEANVDSSYFKIYTMDANQDNKDDLIVGGTKGTVLFINPGNPTQAGAVWEKIFLPSGTGESIYLDDMNGDGKLDVISSNRVLGKVSWIDVGYENGEVVFDITMIDDNLENAFDVNCMDVNGDFKKDVLVTVFQTQAIYWYEAPSISSNPWTQHLVSDAYEGTDLYTGDINEDGKIDFVVAGLFANVIPWFEYNQSLWVEKLIDNNVSWPGDVSLDDLDQDGDLDLVVAGLGEDQMIWYENKMNECEGDLDCDGDVDQTDSSKFAEDYGRHTFYYPCGDAGTGPGTGDADGDGIPNDQDNCWTMQNGPYGGFCAKQLNQNLFEIELSQPCTWHNQCTAGYFCELYQIDSNENGLGDVCECESDFDCDGDVDGSDAAVFFTELGREDCLIRDCSQLYCIY